MLANIQHEYTISQYSTKATGLWIRIPFRSVWVSPSTEIVWLSIVIKTLAHKPQGLRFCVIYLVVICFSCQNKLMTFVLTISLFLFGGHLYVLKCISQQRTVNKTRIHRSQHVQRRHRLVQHSPFPFPQNVVRLTNVLHFCRKIKLIRMGMQMLKVLKKTRCKAHLHHASASMLPELSNYACDSVLIENNGVAPEWGCNPFSSNAIGFNENSIPSVIASVVAALSWCLV